MNYQNFIDKGLLVEEKIGFDQINRVFKRSRQCVKSAKILAKSGDGEGSFEFAYNAMLLSGRALVFSFGLRPRAIGSHKIVVDFTEKILGNNYKVITEKFDKMRKKRNYLIYGIGLTVSKTEADNAIKTAQEFIEKIQKYIEEKDPQGKFDF